LSVHHTSPNMKTALIGFLLASYIFFASARVTLVEHTPLKSGALKQVIKPSPDFDICNVCVSFMEQAIENLLNIIANVGIIGGCAELCSYLPNQIEQAVCNLLCDAVGLEGFITLIQDVDPEPVWICMELRACPIVDNAKANITSLTISPPAGPIGTKFSGEFVLQVVNQIGTGMLLWEVVPPEGNVFGDATIVTNVKPGTYKFAFQFTAKPGKHEPFVPGVYTLGVAACEGECGSKHSHSYRLSERATTFKITK
jgi:hypothetical protein